MLIITYIAFFVFGIYFLCISLFAIGWFRLKISNNVSLKKPIPISVIVACRNEEHNITNLLESLNKQDYSEIHTQIIIINDHSTDNTLTIVSDYVKNLANFTLLNLTNDKSGKKEALAFGIKHANSEIILTTDADCSMHTGWISSMVSYYQHYKPKVLSGPVVIHEKNLFENFQALEFLSLIGSGAGAIGINRAIMCNGANLLFEKSMYFESNLKYYLASGDDIFLMLHAKSKKRNSIQFNKSKKAIVKTNACNSFKDFINQRIRWASKSKAYSDFDIIFTAILVSLTNLFLASILLYTIFENSFFYLYLLLFISKSFADIILIFPVANFFDKTKILWLFVPLQIIYPFYILFTANWGLLGKFNWKGRNSNIKR